MAECMLVDMMSCYYATSGCKVAQSAQRYTYGTRGASQMIGGVLQDVEAIFSVHTEAMTSTGNISSIPWLFIAAGCIFEAKVVGVCGHTAFPHQTVDPLLATSFAVLALQQLVSGEIDLLQSKYCLSKYSTEHL